MPNVDVERRIEWTVARPQFSTTEEESVFFDVSSYEGKVVPLDQLREEVFTYFAEHLRRPTSRLAFWNGKRWRHQDGTDYNSMFAQARASARTKIIADRFEAEGKGWDNGGKLADMDLPFLIMSLPGGVYVTKYGAKNMTYLVEQSGSEEGEKAWRVLSIPSREMDAIEHARVVAPVVGTVLEQDPNYLVANPLVAVALLDDIEKLSRLDEMAANLGYKSYEEILKLAEKSLAADNDSHSHERRTEMVEYFALAFHDAQTNVFYSAHKRENIQRVLADKMRYYFAMEAGSHYLGKDFRTIRDEIDQDVLDGVRKLELGTTRRSSVYSDDADLAELAEIRLREEMRMQILQANEVALESYRATGCVITTRMQNGNYWKQLNLTLSSQRQLNNLFGGEVIVGYEGEGEGSNSEKLHEGDKACYQCPVCEGEGHLPGGDVYLRGGYLVCQRKPDEHRLRYDSSD